MLFRLFARRKKTKGCLDGKTEEEKLAFFMSLREFAITENQFFYDQCNDLLPHELDEFTKWAIGYTENLKMLQALAGTLGDLLKERSVCQ